VGTDCVIRVHHGVRGRVNSGHPDARLVDLEEVGDKVVEIDVFLSVVEEGELAVVAKPALAVACNSETG
jgi:hypothetical protein